MTARKAALNKIYWYIVNNAGRQEKSEYLDALKVLSYPVPDPETGLVPCGCGKRAIFYGFDEKREDGEFPRAHRTAAGCPDCPATTDWEENQDDARRIWNKMMGYKED